MNRAQRRKQAKVDRARDLARKRAGEPILISQGQLITGAGEVVEFAGRRALPDKTPGVHRWIATAMYTLTEAAVAGAMDPDLPKFLDGENLVDVLIGCWDCEQAVGQVEAGSPCPAERVES